MTRRLLEIADGLRAIAQTGLHYTESAYDRERYTKLLGLATELAALADPAAATGPGVRSAETFRALYLASDEGYVTPKLDVRAAVFDRDRVLLVREKVDGRWALPGGYIDIGDSPADAAVRETLEEAHVDVRIERLAGVFDYRLQPLAPPTFFHIHKLVFTARMIDPEQSPSPGDETLEACFHPVGALPDLSAGRTLPIHITTAHAMAEDPGRPTHFD